MDKFKTAVEAEAEKYSKQTINKNYPKMANGCFEDFIAGANFAKGYLSNQSDANIDLDAAIKLRGYFSKNDASIFEHWAYDYFDKIVKQLKENPSNQNNLVVNDNNTDEASVVSLTCTSGNAIEQCGCCGGKKVYIRGKYPKQDKRLICPTCAYERLEQINEISSSNYGQAYKNTDL